MEIIPSIDILGEKVVRLKQGQFGRVTEYPDSPLYYARTFASEGAKFLHIVDLNGSKDGLLAHHFDLDLILKGTALEVQVGGGVRSYEDLESLLLRGVARVVVGTMAVKNRGMVVRAIKDFGSDKVVIALDVEPLSGDYVIKTAGWVKREEAPFWDTISFYRQNGAKWLLCTDASKDGMLKGPSFELYEKILSFWPECKLIASGGVSSLDDIKKLRDLGISAAIVGRAFFEGEIKLEEALTC